MRSIVLYLVSLQAGKSVTQTIGRLGSLALQKLENRLCIPVLSPMSKRFYKILPCVFLVDLTISSQVSLELGGKSPLIIFSDCDLEKAVRMGMGAVFFNKVGI